LLLLLCCLLLLLQLLLHFLWLHHHVTHFTACSLTQHNCVAAADRAGQEQFVARENRTG
jgi:hypothetical protein